MSRNQKAPFVAFVLVALVCGLIVIDAISSQADNAFPPVPAVAPLSRMVSGPTFVRESHVPAPVRSAVRSPVTARQTGRASLESSRAAQPVGQVEPEDAAPTTPIPSGAQLGAAVDLVATALDHAVLESDHDVVHAAGGTSSGPPVDDPDEATATGPSGQDNSTATLTTGGEAGAGADEGRTVCPPRHDGGRVDSVDRRQRCRD